MQFKLKFIELNTKKKFTQVEKKKNKKSSKLVLTDFGQKVSSQISVRK